VHLPGRAFPGINVQGIPLAALRTSLAEAARRLWEESGNVDALDELDYAVEQMGAMLSLYERVLAERNPAHLPTGE
jgi:hypothetical protein